MNLDHITTVAEANEEMKKYDGGWLSLNGLTTPEGLVLPETVGGWLYLDGLTVKERDSVLKTRPDLRVS